MHWPSPDSIFRYLSLKGCFNTEVMQSSCYDNIAKSEVVTRHSSRNPNKKEPLRVEIFNHVTCNVLSLACALFGTAHNRNLVIICVGYFDTTYGITAITFHMGFGRKAFKHCTEFIFTNGDYPEVNLPLEFRRFLVNGN